MAGAGTDSKHHKINNCFFESNKFYIFLKESLLNVLDVQQKAYIFELSIFIVLKTFSANFK